MKKEYIAPECELVICNGDLFIFAASGYSDLQGNEISLFAESDEEDLGNDESSNPDGWFGD